MVGIDALDVTRRKSLIYVVTKDIRPTKVTVSVDLKCIVLGDGWI